MSPASAKLPGIVPLSSVATYTDCRTQRRVSPSANPHAVSPRSILVSGAAPITMRYGGIGRVSRQRHVVRARLPLPVVRESTSAPFATTVRPAGAVTVHVTVALSLGWSTLGIQLRARLGQLSPK